MRRKIFGIALFFVVSCSSPQVMLQGGMRDFQSHDNWEETDRQPTVGLSTNFAGKTGVGPELGVLLSQDLTRDDTYYNRSTDDTASKVKEGYVGLRANYLLREKMQFFIHGGFSAFSAETNVDLSYAREYEDRDFIYVNYIGVGVNYYLFDSMLVGVGYRRIIFGEDIEIFNLRPETNDEAFLATIGWQL